MLSFRDTLLEVLSRPSFNSTPTNNFDKILNTVNLILGKYQKKAPDEYLKADALNKDIPHPLYNDESSIFDLLDVYQR